MDAVKWMRRTTWTCVAGALLVVPMLTAVPAGAASGSTKAAAAIRRSVSQTAARGSAQIAGEVDYTSGSTRGKVTSSGVVDFSNRDLSLTVDVSQLTHQPASVEVRVVDGDAYVDISPLLRVLPLGALAQLANIQWVKLSPGELSTSLNPQGVAPALGTDAEALLQALQGVTNGSVARVGPDTVRDVPTIRYHADVNLQLALSKLPSALQSRLQGELAKVANPTAIPVDVWIDSAGLVRRVAISVTVHPKNGTAVHADASFDLFNFGVPVSVQPPPASEVTDLSALRSLLPLTRAPAQ